MPCMLQTVVSHKRKPCMLAPHVGVTRHVMFVRGSGDAIFVNESQSLRASGTSSSMGLCEPWIRSSPSLGSLRTLDQVVALVKDLCEPSDVGDENQLLGQVVLADGSQQVQQQHLKQVQHRHLIYANRSSREAVASACIRSTTRPKANRLRTTHATRDGPCGHVFATILGRGPPGWAAGPLSGQVEPGSPPLPRPRTRVWNM